MHVFSQRKKWQKKKTLCIYCEHEVSNFERHLQRNHRDQNEVNEFLALPKKSKERRQVIEIIRNSGHFKAYLSGEIKPKYQRAKDVDAEYYPCSHCKGLYKRAYLCRHYKSCVAKPEKHTKARSAHLSKSQTLLACALDNTNTINKLRLRKEVLDIMKADNISLVVKTDILICSYGDNLLKKHKRKQMAVVISNRMRELARFLIAFRTLKDDSKLQLIDAIDPRCFDAVVECAKIVGGYDPGMKTYSAPSVSAHLGTSLKQVAALLIRMLLKNDIYAKSKITDLDEKIKQVERFQQLVTSQWTTEISSLAFKDLNEKRWNKPAILPLAKDIVKFKDYVQCQADSAIALLDDQPNNTLALKQLLNAALVLTIMYNRRRIGDVQYTSVSSYFRSYGNLNPAEFMESLTESERILTRQYKRIITGGKGSRPVCILLPKHIQRYVEQITTYRKMYEDSNPYLFGFPSSNMWLRGDVAIRKFAKKAELQHPEAITSNKLRKHIATIMQLISMEKDDIEQFSIFMGHNEKTHDEFYKYVIFLYILISILNLSSPSNVNLVLH